MGYERRDNGSHEPDVSIIILNWNTAKLLEQCLTSVIRNTNDVSYEIVIIDNNSAGSDFKGVKQKFSEYTHFTWIENDKNIGASACNQALPHCRGRYLLILGPDTIVLAQSLKRMVDFLDENKEAGAVTAKLLNPDMSPQNYYFKFWNLSMVFLSTGIGQLIDEIFFRGRFWRYYFGESVDANKVGIVESPAAACFMLRRDSLAEGYLIDENFPFYFNDGDLCKRIYQSGYKIFLLPSAEVIHYTSSSFKQTDKKWRVKERRTSLIKYFKKYHKRKVVFLKLILMLDVATRYIYKKFSPGLSEK